MTSKDQETRFQVKQNSLKRDSSKEQHGISQPPRFSTRSWKSASRLREIKLESKWNSAFHLASSSRKQRFKE
ncbi:hypothetical protein MtrunA17_Chr1g0167671 [Medicago truncatula]|uniref:Uncharacterized protein n=1 Tax=Medicago truncatula TaxID=3880 RepID=A0A072VSM6_MEDTR|nr:hypothetical protein MTR_1g043055 [Medicago truncatula]RHN78596.1 hypothetical protein MtrunA17_Chr1g0167671 [Medicago truncatula]